MTEIIVPHDFMIVYASGDSHGGRPGPRTHIEVLANGILKYFNGYWKGGSAQLPLEQREISQENVKRIYVQVVGCGFFDLDEHYRNPRIMGGISSYISVRASGKTHGVSASGYSVQRFNSILKTLHKEAGIPTIINRSRGK
jgi:hypothetical protein